MVQIKSNLFNAEQIYLLKTNKTTHYSDKSTPNILHAKQQQHTNTHIVTKNELI